MYITIIIFVILILLQISNLKSENYNAYSLADTLNSNDNYEIKDSWKKFYDEYNIDGAFVLYDLKNDKYFVYNFARTQTPFLPASTFKIFNSLVALETKVIKDENEIIPWDSIDRGWEMWNMDQNLKSGIKYSAVWFYQELARRIGQENMQRYIDESNYGNKNISGGIDRFWLDGELRISPYEQIQFLKKLYQNNLPFSQKTIDIVKKIILQEETDSYKLSGKTGWAIRIENQIGWFVGYLETNDNVYLFANNIEIRNDKDADARIGITRKILKDLELM